MTRRTGGFLELSRCDSCGEQFEDPNWQTTRGWSPCMHPVYLCPACIDAGQTHVEVGREMDRRHTLADDASRAGILARLQGVNVKTTTLTGKPGQWRDA